jgi:membrane dipeptidase
MHEGNLNSIFFSVYVPQRERTPENYKAARAQARMKFDAIHRMANEMYPEQISIATSAAQTRQLQREGKFAALIGLENAFGFGEDLSTVEEFYQQGMRYGGFAHFGHNRFADSSLPLEPFGDEKEEHGGLSLQGRELLKEYNRLGVMADVSHSSKAASLEIARLSSAPIIASHSAVFGVAAIPRNMSDAEMLAVKNTGGVVQIVAYDTYLKDPAPEKKDALNLIRAEYGVSRFTWGSLPADVKAAYLAEVEKLHVQWPRATVDDFVNHIDYAVRLIGIDHVGIASDFGGGGGVVGWMNASETENVTRALIANGFSREDIQKLWGGNLLRVMARVQDLAQ